MASYESEEDETVTATSIKKVLKYLMDDFKNVSGISAARELAKYKAEYEAIAKIEKQIKDLKAKVKEKQTELDIKLRLKRVGGEEFRAETEGLIQQVMAEMAGLKPNDKNDKRKIAGLTKDREALEKRLTRIDGLLVAIGGPLTTEEAKELILQKLYDWVSEQLTRYLNGAKRALIALVEKLWDKYAVSSRELEAERSQTLTELNDFLVKLGYLN